MSRQQVPEKLQEMLCLSFLGAAALGLRLSMLPARFPYIDDLLQLYAAARPTWAQAAAAVSGIGAPQAPLDYLFSFFSARFSQDLECLRLLPVLWGTATVLAAYRLGLRLWSRELGLWWGALAACSMPLVSFSVTFRPYALSIFLGLLSWSAFEGLRRGESAWPYALAHGLFQAAYPHAWLLGAAQLLEAGLYGSRPFFSRALRSQSLAWALLVAWIVFWYLPMMRAAAGFQYEVPLSILAEIGRSFNLGGGRILFPLFGALGAAAGLRSEAARGPMRTALLWLGPGAAGVWCVHRMTGALLAPRHMFPFLPAYLGIVAAGFTAARSRLIGSSGAGRPIRGMLGIAALATLLVWTAWGPLARLQLREARMSGYLRGFQEELSRRTGAHDVLVFSHPNTGATLLYALDRGAFLGLAGIRMRHGFVFFLFPERLEVRVGARRLRAYTACARAGDMASLDSGALAALRKRVRAEGGRVWLVSLEGLNAASDARDFSSLGLRDADMSAVAPGLFRY